MHTPTHKQGHTLDYTKPDSSDMELDANLATSSHIAAEISGCPLAYISLYEDQYETIRASFGFTAVTRKRYHRLLLDLPSDNAPHISHTPTLNQFYNDSVFSLVPQPIAMVATLPLVTNDNTVIGALCLADFQARQLSPVQLRALQTVALHVRSQLALHEQQLVLQRKLESLEDSEQRFRRIADASPVLLWISDISGHRTLSNRAWCDFTGLSEEESLAGCWRSALHPDDTAVYQAKWVECVRDQKRFQHEFRLRHHSGTFRWVLEQAIPLFLSNGRLEAYISSCVDLSLRNSDELQYQHNEARFRAVSEAAPLGIVVTDSSGHCIYSNHKFQKISGLTLEESLGTGWLRTVHEDDRDEIIVAWVNATNIAQSFEKVFRYQRSEGSVAWCSLKAAAINSTDTVSGWVSTIEDITAKREAESALVRAMQAAENAMHAKNQFLANVSHEIRTPLTAIIGFADALREDGNLQPAQLQYMDVILNNGRHLLTIINQILDLSKIDAGALTIEPSQCDLIELIDEMLFMFTPTVAAKSLYLNVSYDWPLPRTVTTDPLRLRQVLINLLGNAIKFTQQGGVTLGISWKPTSQHLIFSISDTGIGISPEQRKGLFTPFYQANDSMNRSFGGTGLGLSISQRLVQALGGTIEVHSEHGKGSTFTFTIKTGAPSADVLLNQAPVAQPHTASGRAAPPALQGRVLFADDAVDNRRLVAHLLKQTGAQVTMVENGQEAIEAAKHEHFDLILMDIQMPIVDGLTATHIIRKAGIMTPIVAISAGAMTTDVRKALEAGCSMHLSKPFERAAFYEMLTRFIQPIDANKKHQKTNITYSAVDDTDPEMSALILEFVHGLPAKSQELRNAAERKDFAGISKLAHKLKGSSGMYGFPRLSVVAKTLEQASKERNEELIQGAIKELEQEVSSILHGAAAPNQAVSSQHP